jgi:phosphopantetheine adenylyltransferase
MSILFDGKFLEILVLHLIDIVHKVTAVRGFRTKEDHQYELNGDENDKDME